MSWIALSLAIAMASCMAGWNAAAHRQEETGLMKFLFYAFTVGVVVSIVYALFGRGCS